ncbi:MAG: cell wall-binding repeat-containing protein, partial [Gracilibacteraceae bacterium]|nr:cell wall-binding repeat-containing protein [Gracilibacteraceae bacterium]
ATSQNIAREIIKRGGVDTVVVTTAYTNADALSIASIAAAKGWPILLSGANGLSAEARAIISEADPTRTYVIGGTGAVSAATAAGLPGVTRLGGADRYATNTEILRHFADQFDYSKGLFVANGANNHLVDALCASAYIAGAPLYISGDAGLGAGEYDLLSNVLRLKDFSQLTSLGGAGSISETTLTTVHNALQTGAGETPPAVQPSGGGGSSGGGGGSGGGGSGGGGGGGGTPVVSAFSIYIAPSGNDSADGTATSPLATLAGARDKIRALKESSGLPDGGVTVYVRGGTYPVTEPVFFDESDSGTANAPIRYAAYPGETPVFNGGVYIKGSEFSEIIGEAESARLSRKAQDEVLCYDLFANGFSDDDLDYAKDFWQAGNLKEYVADEYYANDYSIPRMQVFIDDDALYPARYPNKTDGIFAENPYNQYLMIPEVLETGFDPDTERLNEKQCVFKTYEERIKDWKSLEDIVIFGMIGWEFFQDEIVAENIDTENMTITLRGAPSSGVMERGRYAFSNVFEELDAPGEYYIDKNTGMLYIYPTKDMKNAAVKISRFDESYIIDASGASHLAFSGLTFELTKGSVFHIAGGENCSVENCTLKNFGINGVTLGEWVLSIGNFAAVYDAEDKEEFQRYLGERSTAENVIGHKITGCTFLNTGHAAADIRSCHSGYREPGGAVFASNTVKHSGLIGSAYRSGLLLSGCGITVTGNAFLFCRGQAIDGNIIDTEITYNEFCDSPSDMAEDTGAIYLNYMGQNDGVKIRYNYFHDITNRGHYNYGFDYARRSVAGYDNAQPFRDFSYNVIYNTPGIPNPMSPVSPSTTVNNVFIDCDYVLDYPDEYIRDHYKGETGREIIETLNTLPNYYLNGLYKDPLWRENYPDLYEFYEYMANEKQDMRPVMAQVYNNLIVYLDKRMSGRATELPETVEADAKYGRVENNHFLYADPGFTRARDHNFQLSRQTAAQYGVEWLDMSKIGAPGGLAQLDRLSDHYADPLWGVAADKEISVEILGGQHYAMVSFWRQVTPDVWEWAFDAALNGEFAASFPAKPNGTYTAFYQGDENYPPQFMGGIIGTVGDAPPDGAETFTVEPEHGQWDYFPFKLEN